MATWSLMFTVVAGCVIALVLTLIMLFLFLKEEIDWKSFTLSKISTNFKLIVVIYLITVLVCSGLFSVIEDKSFFDSVWYVCVTALTIGYGDMYATTTAGRCIMILFAHIWVFGIAPLVIVNILERVVKDRNEFSHEEQEEIKTLLRTILEDKSK